MLSSKLTLIALCALLAGGGLIYGGHALYKLIVERETCKMGLEQQNKAILEQNIEVNDYVVKLQAQKDSIARKYSHLIHEKPMGVDSCAHEMEKIKRSLEVFGNGR
ncbi:hypothetical protein [Helicobacter salomonis]|uniref:hypothetical protein n=1 Tax=Helicobacter salomonis TaxID=56878 RepID=UPI000CF05F85|nr:hypothetical protein [Helicobacter salomonis]